MKHKNARPKTLLARPDFYKKLVTEISENCHYPCGTGETKYNGLTIDVDTELPLFIDFTLEE